MKPSIKITLSILLSLSTVVGIVVWDLILKDKIDTVEVLVVAPGVEIEAKQMITGKEFIVEKRPKSSLIENVLLPSDLQHIIGYDASIPLMANQLVSLLHIDFDRIIPDPNKEEAIRPIPSEWMYMQPGSLRRKDRINIYMLDKDFISNVTGNYTKNQENPNHSIFMPSPQEITSLYDLEPVLSNIPVVYAKDGSNNEVIDTTVSHEDGSRLNASGKISELELNMNEEDFKLLIGYINQGYKIYITYH